MSTDTHLKNREKGWFVTNFGTKAIFRFCSVCTVDPVILSISFNRHLCSQQTKNSPGQHALTQSRARAWIKRTARGTVPLQMQGKAWVSLRPESFQQATREAQWDQDTERPWATSLTRPRDSYPHLLRLHQEMDASTLATSLENDMRQNCYSVCDIRRLER